MIQALQSNGVKGIVFASTGAGGLSEFERDAMKPFCHPHPEQNRSWSVPNRTGTGRVIARKEYDELG
jgi:hypothetical protein